MSPTDIVLAAGILGFAVLVLYRSLRRTGAGGCHGCNGCAEKPPGGLVRLGGLGRGEGRSPEGSERWPREASCDTRR
jgi:hypothetical protein